MILHLNNGTQKYIPMFGAMGAPHVDTLTLDASDVRDLLRAPEGFVREYLQTMYMRFYPIPDEETAADNQRRQVEDHNRRLKGSEAIDDFHPAQFTADPPRNMFIGPGLVPYNAEGMTRLDPESAQVLADNLWDMYTRSDK